MFKNVLIVCIGNICRSPMAEGVLAEALRNRSSRVVVHSAGLAALVGRQADPMSQLLMAERGIDISAHRARQIKDSYLKEAELVLVMDKSQQREIESVYPSACGKIYCLGKWIDADIPDPYRGTRADFEASLSLIDRSLDIWLAKAWK